jgi:hypothetical protein
MFNTKIIFSIDNGYDLHTVAKFMRNIDTARAIGDLNSSFIQCIGSYKGKLENSFILDESDYKRFVEEKGFTLGQETVLVVPGNTRQNCTLLYNDCSYIELGPMRKFTKEEALKLEAWTYVIATDSYWSTL